MVRAGGCVLLMLGWGVMEGAAITCTNYDEFSVR
jgi:hypothetical protein